MPNRTFRCPSCGALIDDYKKLSEEIVHEHKCACGYEGTMEMDFSNCKVGMLGLKNFFAGKSAQQISDYLVPDSQGNYLSP